MNKINITEEQLETLEHYQNMFRHTSDTIKDLCSQEQHDVVYGFELGKMYSHLEECYRSMLKLTDDIKSNTQ